jgi:hypothetical protein
LIATAVRAGLIDGRDVLEVGAGSLRNVPHYSSKAKSVSVSELPIVIQRYSKAYDDVTARGGEVTAGSLPSGRFSVVIMTFVLETICQPRDRYVLLKEVASHLSKRGVLLLEVRGPKDLRLHRFQYEPLSDGFYSAATKTFVRGFTKTEVKAMLSRVGLVPRTWHSKVESGYSVRVEAIHG